VGSTSAAGAWCCERPESGESAGSIDLTGMTI
jgi:hypothetical protein